MRRRGEREREKSEKTRTLTSDCLFIPSPSALHTVHANTHTHTSHITRKCTGFWLSILAPVCHRPSPIDFAVAALLCFFPHDIYLSPPAAERPPLTRAQASELEAVRLAAALYAARFSQQPHTHTHTHTPSHSITLRHHSPLPCTAPHRPRHTWPRLLKRSARKRRCLTRRRSCGSSSAWPSSTTLTSATSLPTTSGSTGAPQRASTRTALLLAHRPKHTRLHPSLLPRTFLYGAGACFTLVLATGAYCLVYVRRVLGRRDYDVYAPWAVPLITAMALTGLLLYVYCTVPNVLAPLRKCRGARRIGTHTRARALHVFPAATRSIIALWPVYGLLTPPLVIVVFLSSLFALILLSPVFG